MVVQYLHERGLPISATTFVEELGPDADFAASAPCRGALVAAVLGREKHTPPVFTSSVPPRAQKLHLCRQVAHVAIEALLKAGPETPTPSSPVSLSVYPATPQRPPRGPDAVAAALCVLVRNTVTARRMQLLPLLETILKEASPGGSCHCVLDCLTKLVPMKGVPRPEADVDAVVNAVLAVCSARGSGWTTGTLVPWIVHKWESGTPPPLAVFLLGQCLAEPATVEGTDGLRTLTECWGRDAVAVFDKTRGHQACMRAMRACLGSVVTAVERCGEPCNRLLLATSMDAVIGILLSSAEADAEDDVVYVDRWGGDALVASPDALGFSVRWVLESVLPRVAACASRLGWLQSLYVKQWTDVWGDVASSLLEGERRGGSSSVTSDGSASSSAATATQAAQAAHPSNACAPSTDAALGRHEVSNKWMLCVSALGLAVPLLVAAAVQEFQKAPLYEEEPFVGSCCACMQRAPQSAVALTHALAVPRPAGADDGSVLDALAHGLPQIIFEAVESLNCHAPAHRSLAVATAHLLRDLALQLGPVFVHHVLLPQLLITKLGLPVACLAECVALDDATAKRALAPHDEETVVESSCAPRRAGAMLLLLHFAVLQGQGQGLSPRHRKTILRCVAVCPRLAQAVSRTVMAAVPAFSQADEWLDVLGGVAVEHGPEASAAALAFSEGLLSLQTPPTALAVEAHIGPHLSKVLAGATDNQGVITRACHAAVAVMCASGVAGVQAPLQAALQNRWQEGPTWAVRAVLHAVSRVLSRGVACVDAREWCVRQTQIMVAAMRDACAASDVEMARISSHLAGAGNASVAAAALAATRRATVQLRAPWVAAQFEEFEDVSMDICECFVAAKGAGMAVEDLSAQLLSSGLFLFSKSGGCGRQRVECLCFSYRFDSFIGTARPGKGNAAGQYPDRHHRRHRGWHFVFPVRSGGFPAFFLMGWLSCIHCVYVSSFRFGRARVTLRQWTGLRDTGLGTGNWTRAGKRLGHAMAALAHLK